MMQCLLFMNWNNLQSGILYSIKAGLLYIQYFSPLLFQMKVIALLQQGPGPLWLVFISHVVYEFYVWVVCFHQLCTYTPKSTNPLWLIPGPPQEGWYCRISSLSYCSVTVSASLMHSVK